MRQMKEKIADQYLEQFALFHFSLGGLRGVGVARDEEADVFSGPHLDLPALLQRYKDYLYRLKEQSLENQIVIVSQFGNWGMEYYYSIIISLSEVYMFAILLCL